FSGVFLVWSGLRRPGPGMDRLAVTWPRRRLWLGLGGAVLTLGLTFWNIDLAVRADLAIALQGGGAFLLVVDQPPVARLEHPARAIEDLGRRITVLASDARVKAREGTLARAFEDVTAILRIFRHLSDTSSLSWGREFVAWRTLEDVLRLAPAGKEPLPALAIP